MVASAADPKLVIIRYPVVIYIRHIFCNQAFGGTLLLCFGFFVLTPLCLFFHIPPYVVGMHEYSSPVTSFDIPVERLIRAIDLATRDGPPALAGADEVPLGCLVDLAAYENISGSVA